MDNVEDEDILYLHMAVIIRLKYPNWIVIDLETVIAYYYLQLTVAYCIETDLQRLI